MKADVMSSGWRAFLSSEAHMKGKRQKVGGSRIFKIRSFDD